MKHRTVLIVWLFLPALFALLACRATADPTPETETRPETPVAQGAPTAVSAAQPTGAAPESADTRPSPQYGELKTYRSLTTLIDQNTGEQEQLINELILEPFAMRMEMPTGAMIMTGEGVWMQLFDDLWYQMDLTEEELAMSPQAFMALGDPELEELPDRPDWPSGIVFMPDQASLPLVEGGLTPTGRETIDGISCRRHTVTTDYSYEIAATEYSPAGRHRMQATGTVCVIDQPGLPAIVIDAEIDKRETWLLWEGQEDVGEYQVVYRITEINPSLSIEPPADAVSLNEFGGGFFDEPDPPPAETADLSGLESYRLEILITVIMDDYEATRRTSFEWVQDPPAWRYEEDLGEMTIAWVWVDQKHWMRMAGGEWMEISADEEPELPHTAVALFEDDQAELVGTETVNGVRCLHYRDELTIFDATVWIDTWVADEPDLPPVIIRSVQRMEQEGYTTVTESNLYDLNRPIVIEPPR